MWTEVCQKAFNTAKAVLMNAPVLRAPDFAKPFRLMTDASELEVGLVLSQENDQGIDHPVGFYSKKLNQHQRKYSTIEKETLVLILALQHFEVFVTSGEYPVKVCTDHNPFTFLRKKRKTKNQRLVRWSLLLQQYDLKIEQVPERQNVVADAVSRVV